MDRERYLHEPVPHVMDFEEEVRDFEQRVRGCKGNFRTYVSRVFAEMSQRGQRPIDDEKNVVRGID